MKKIKIFPSYIYFWTATIISLLPAILFLALDASDWPNNWDDFQRLFNGISPGHNVIGYGIEQSNIMMKLAIHDPILTISNRLRFQFPLLSIIIEVVLLILPILFFSRLAYLKGEVLLCIALSMGFSGLMVIHTVFLPPAAYPLGFSLAFCSALFISIELFSSILNKHLPFIVSIMLVFIEQITFIFYATCYLQSFFITFIGILILMICFKHLLSKRKLFKLFFINIIRFSIFPLLTFIWRLTHITHSGETLSPDLRVKGIIYAFLKWSFGGTTISTLWDMGHPKIKWIDNTGISQTLVLFLIIIIFTICLAIWDKVSSWSGAKTNRSEISNIFFKNLNPYLATGIIGLSICLAWSLPIVSNRYYSEMQQDNSQIYVAMRYSSYGLILLITSVIGYIFKLIAKLMNRYTEHFNGKFYSTNVTRIFVSLFFPLWIYSGLVNINSLYAKHDIAPHGISLATICNRENFTQTDSIFFGYLVPGEVIDDGVEIWLPSLDIKKNNIDNNLRKFIGKTFILNSLRLCGK